MTIQIAPELEAGLRTRAAADGVRIEDVISKAVGDYLRRSTARRLRRVPVQDRNREMAWAAHPDPAYAGRWVVLDGNQVIANGTNGRAVYEDALAKGITSPFLVFVAPNEQDPFVGGWTD